MTDEPSIPGLTIDDRGIRSLGKQRAQISSNLTRRTLTAPTIIAAVFLGLHVLPLFWRPNPMWGVDFLYYLPAPVQGIFILLSVLLFVPAFRRRIRGCVRALHLALWGEGRRVWVGKGLLVLVALAAFVALSSARHFLGDGYHVLEKLNSDTWHDIFRAPLSVTLIRALHQVGQASWETAENTYRIYSYLSGVLYVLIAFPTAAALGKNTLEKSVVLVFLLTTGTMQLFFGYVENYALYMPGLLLYLLLAMRVLENRMPMYVPALLLGMLFALHRAFIVFGPTLLFLAYRAWRNRQERVPTWKNVLATAVALCCVPLSTALCLGLSGVDFNAYLTGMSSGDVLPVFAEPGFYAQYRIFSLTHLMDFVNQQLLSAPAACMAIFLVRKRHLGRHTFLAICTVVPLFFTFIAKANIGAFRDWDILSLPALPFTLWAATAFVEKIRDREQLFHGAFLICGAAALHTLLWIGVNANAGAAEARFVHQVGRLSGHAGATGWVTLAKYHQSQDNNAAAFEAYKHALVHDPTNAQRWISTGAVALKMGQSVVGIDYLKRANELQPDLALPYMNLGAAYYGIGQYASALQCLTKAIELQPDLAAAYVNLGAVYRAVGQHDKAIQAFEKALELRPDHAGTYLNLGVVYNDAGQHAKAIGALKKAIALQPDDASAYGNLGVVYCDIGQFADAIEYLKKALELHPDYALAHANLGYVYKVQRQYPLAIEHFEKALELQSGGSNVQTLMNIGDTYHNMGQHEKAIPYFKKGIQLDPANARAHLLLGLSYRALNRMDEARSHIEKALKLKPNHPHAAQIKQWLERLRK